MTILVGILLLLVIICFLLILNSTAEIEKLRIQNKQLIEQMNKMRENYENLLKKIQDIPSTPMISMASTDLNKPLEEGTTQGSVGLNDAEKLQILKNNAYKLQNIIEAFAYDHGGTYPPDLKTLDTYATNTYINEVVTNPYTNKKAYVTDNSMCIDITFVPVDEGLVENAGKLLFQANPDENGKITTYTIALFDGNGFLVKDENGNIFVLSNMPMQEPIELENPLPSN